MAELPQSELFIGFRFNSTTEHLKRSRSCCAF